MPAVTRGITRQDVGPALLVGLLQVAGTTVTGMHQQALSSRPLDLGGYLLLTLGPVLLLWRRRNPPLVLVSVLAVTLGFALLDYPRGPIYLALVVAFAQTVLAGYRGVALAVMVVGYPSLTLLTAQVTGREQPGLPFLIGVAAWLLVLLVGSELVRSRRAYAAERRRRGREAELARAEEARRRAGEERLAIARELHDVMAHSISLINVQAGVALELMDRRPEQARQALTAIKAASKDALLEVQSVLASLRGTEGPGLGPVRSVTSSPGLAALDRLVARARLSGVEVQTRVDGVAVPLPAGLDQAAGRIVQEALTNVARHARPTGTVTAQLQVGYRTDAGGGPTELVIVVDNDTAAEPSGPPGPGGRGIAGMRERAQAYGGTLEAAPRPGGFRLEAHLPIVENPSESAGIT